MNINIFYFSATGNTEKIANVIKEKFVELGAKAALSDITSLGMRQKGLDLSSYDAFLFGAPIHSCRAPRAVREWLKTLDGQGKKCSMFFTYGGFGVHPTHYSTKKILEDQNFRVVSSAEFLGAHTFNLGGWKAVEERPHNLDFEVAKEYAEKTHERFTGEENGLLGEMEKTEHTEEFLDSIESFRFKVLTKLPTREGQECGMCMICEENCPTGAMNAETGEAAPGKCIACLSCVANCPESVLKINDMSQSWLSKLKMEKATKESIKEKESRIYL